jgi:hypothetical protein
MLIMVYLFLQNDKGADFRSWLNNDPATSSLTESRLDQDQLKKYIEMVLLFPLMLYLIVNYNVCLVADAPSWRSAYART